MIGYFAPNRGRYLPGPVTKYKNRAPTIARFLKNCPCWAERASSGMAEQGGDIGKSQQYRTCFPGPYPEYQGSGTEDFYQNHKIYDEAGKRHALCGQRTRKAENFEELADTGLQRADRKAPKKNYRIIYLCSHWKLLLNLASALSADLSSRRACGRYEAA